MSLSACSSGSVWTAAQAVQDLGKQISKGPGQTRGIKVVSVTAYDALKTPHHTLLAVTNFGEAPRFQCCLIQSVSSMLKSCDRLHLQRVFC